MSEVVSDSRTLAKVDLDRELSDLAARHPALERHELFVLWFVRAYVTNKDHEALEALTGFSSEKGIDALHIDDATDLVTIVQGKLRGSIMVATEKNEVVMAFARLAEDITGPESEFLDFARDLEPLTQRKVRAARKRLLEKDYRLNLQFVTLGRCSKPLVTRAKKAARAAGSNTARVPELKVFDGDAVLSVLGDYLDGVAPPVPSLELESAGEVAYQHDPASGVESWIFSMNGAKVGGLIDSVGEKLFARNIRGFLGDVKINNAMRQALQDHPESFLFLNNGITLICDGANAGQAGGVHLLEVFNPQIINGQQTTYVLHDAGAKSKKAKVFVRVLAVGKGPAAKGWADYEKMVGSIVEATNSQNTIKSSDLRANDRVQVRLQAHLRQLNYFYSRKRGRSHEGELAAQHNWKLTKEEVARAVMASDSAATLLNEGVQSLFEEPQYSRVFRLKPKPLLSRSWLMKEVGSVAWGSGERQAAKFLVVQFLWSQLGASIEKSPDSFLEACEDSDSDVRMTSLRRAIQLAMKGAIEHYRKDRGVGADRLEANPFFKRRDRYEEFERFWRSRRSTHRTKFTKAAREFKNAL